MEKLIFTTTFIILVPLVIYLSYKEIRFFRESVILTGKVVELRVQRGNKGHSYAPEIDVIMPDGTTMRYSHQTYSNPASFAMGDMVPMGYDGDRLAIMHFWNRFGAVFVFSSILLTMMLYVAAKGYYENMLVRAISAQSTVEKQ